MIRVYSLPRAQFYHAIEAEGYSSRITEASLKNDVVTHLSQTWDAAEVLRRWTHERVSKGESGGASGGASA